MCWFFKMQAPAKCFDLWGLAKIIFLNVCEDISNSATLKKLKNTASIWSQFVFFKINIIFLINLTNNCSTEDVLLYATSSSVALA